MIMPEIDGKTTYKKMKEINPDIITLLSSGYSINGEAQKILDDGVNGFIQKPFQISDIIRLISEIFTENEEPGV